MRSALVLVPALLLTACGGGGDSAYAQQKKAYLAKANAVCAKGVQARKAAGTPSSVVAIPGYVQSVVLQAADLVAELDALDPPPRDAQEIQNKVILPLRRQVAEGQDYAKKVRQAAAKDPNSVLALLGQAPTQVQADVGFLKSYGLTTCAQAVDVSGG